MFRATHEPNDIYKYRRIKIRTTILETIYKKPCINMKSERHDNDRLRFRFREAIREAEEICADNKGCHECYNAWYEVDELEDSLMRLGEEVIQENNMRYEVSMYHLLLMNKYQLNLNLTFVDIIHF